MKFLTKGNGGSNENSKLATSFQEGTETSFKTTSITSGKSQTQPLEKVSTKPFQAEGFRVS